MKTNNPYDLLKEAGVIREQLSEKGQNALKQYDQGSKLAWRHRDLKELQTELQEVGTVVCRIIEKELERFRQPKEAPQMKITVTTEMKENDRLFARLAALRDKWKDHQQQNQVTDSQFSQER